MHSLPQKQGCRLSCWCRRRRPCHPTPPTADSACHYSVSCHVRATFLVNSEGDRSNLQVMGSYSVLCVFVQKIKRGQSPGALAAPILPAPAPPPAPPPAACCGRFRSPKSPSWPPAAASAELPPPVWPRRGGGRGSPRSAGRRRRWAGTAHLESGGGRPKTGRAAWRAAGGVPCREAECEVSQRQGT